MRGWHIFSTPQRKFLKELWSNPRSAKQICKGLNQHQGRVMQWMDENPKFRQAVDQLRAKFAATLGKLDEDVLRLLGWPEGWLNASARIARHAGWKHPRGWPNFIRCSNAGG